MNICTSLNLAVRMGLGILLLLALPLLMKSASAQDDLPPPKGEVCDLFGCGGGPTACMDITYLASIGGADVLITFNCYEG